MPAMKLKTLLPFILVGTAALAGGLYVGQRLLGDTPPVIDGVLYPAPRALPEFRLVNGAGETVTRESLAGEWHWLFFGFTHCPDVCPTTLATLDRAADALGPRAPGGVFVSVDPERDTPQKVGEYAAFFNPDFIGLTGGAGQIAALAQAAGIAYTYVPIEGTNRYTVDHTAAVLLLDPRARIVAVFTPPHRAEALARDFIAVRDYLGD